MDGIKKSNGNIAGGDRLQLMGFYFGQTDSRDRRVQ